MSPPITAFAVKDPYSYLEGLGNYHSSEAIPGAIVPANNSPQRPPFGLRTERISGGSFTQPREQSSHTFLYRAQSSLQHGEFVPLELSSGYGPRATATPAPAHLSPNSYHWAAFPVPDSAHWITGQALLGRNGDPAQKDGCAIWVFSLTDDMPERHAFSSLDGELLIIPQSGALDLQTELGRLMVRQNEIAVIPRGVRHRVTLPEGKACRGYVCELYQGHFRLPDLGVIGSTGLANVRDFQIPAACFDGELEEGIAKPRDAAAWTIVSRLGGAPWQSTQTHTPFDVAAWHGTCYPFKFDLGRFCPLGNVLFDEHDPSLYTVLTARHHGAEPGTAVVDFALVPPRWNAAEETLWLPYYHRNTMQEFFGPVVYAQDPEHPCNGAGAAHRFSPFGAGLHGAMSPHGPSDDDMSAMRAMDTLTPQKQMTQGISIFLIETDRPLLLSEWAVECAERDQSQAPARSAKM